MPRCGAALLRNVRALGPSVSALPREQISGYHDATPYEKIWISVLYCCWLANLDISMSIGIILKYKTFTFKSTRVFPWRVAFIPAMSGLCTELIDRGLATNNEQIPDHAGSASPQKIKIPGDLPKLWDVSLFYDTSLHLSIFIFYYTMTSLQLIYLRFITFHRFPSSWSPTCQSQSLHSLPTAWFGNCKSTRYSDHFKTNMILAYPCITLISL